MFDDLFDYVISAQTVASLFLSNFDIAKENIAFGKCDKIGVHLSEKGFVLD